MAAIAIAGGVASNLGAKVLEVLGTEAVRKAASWWGARDDLKKLESTMTMIQARVHDAERRQEGENSELVRLWLRRLKLVLYRADDLFDEVLTLDHLKRDMEKTTLAKVGVTFSTLSHNRRLAKEIKSIKKELYTIQSDMVGLNLGVLVADELRHPISRFMKGRQTSSYVNVEDVIGRDDDASLIIEMLLDPKYDGEQITVIPITGFGGLGKTTLAQLIFNDDRVKNHFDLCKWAHVPEMDDHIVMMGKIFKSFTNKNYDDQTLEQIQQGIRESIESNKYLLVLDDLWDERAHILTDLVSLLKCGKQGSKVIVTSRSDLVAKVVGTIEKPHKLGTLTFDQSWNFLKRLAFKPGQEDMNPGLSIIGKEIVRMCGNVPLAIKVVGGFLRCKDTEEEWSQVRDTQCLRAQQTQGDNVMAALKLSYDYLTPELKQCFAYCSLFPKGYQFEKDELVCLWMAQGYVQPNNGDEYFWDLVARNLLFQRTSYSIAYIMHDLLHDLAQAVAGDEMLAYERPKQIHGPDRLIHVYINGSTCPSSMKNAKRLRSLLQFTCNAGNENLFSEFQSSLRVLSISNYEIQNLPNSIGSFIHLRYLKLQRNKIERLPDSITRLVNLQTLDLYECRDLKVLPTEFSKLVNLRHLLLPLMKLTDLPPGFGKLTCLQELNRFIVGKGNGIDSLGAWNLRGLMLIEFRRWRGDAIEEVKRACLKDNHHLTCLFLCLGLEEEETTPADGEMNKMLKCLQLPPNLEQLFVLEYKGSELPGGWLDGLCKLVSISISEFKRCKALPHLRLLPHLKSLTLHDLDELEYIEDEDNTATQNSVFQSLEHLELWRCYKLKGWRRASKDDVVSPRLLSLNLDECPMLSCMLVAPKLESLDVNNINWKMVESNLSTNHEKEAASSSSAPPSTSKLFTSLKNLSIEGVDDGLITLSISSSLCNLSTITISNCSNLRKLKFESSNSIKKLTIQKCNRLENISEGFHHLSVLENLNIKQMENWTELPEKIGDLPLLRRLAINRCPKVKSLPPSIQGLASLQTLKIWKCPDLTKKSMPDGKDWHLIKHIPNIDIYDHSNQYQRKDGKVLEHSTSSD